MQNLPGLPESTPSCFLETTPHGMEISVSCLQLVRAQSLSWILQDRGILGDVPKWPQWP